MSLICENVPILILAVVLSYVHNLYVQTQVKVEIPPNEPDSQEFCLQRLSRLRRIGAF